MAASNSSSLLVLRAIKAHGPITIPELDRLGELASLPISGSKSPVYTLKSKGAVDSERKSHHGTIYTITKTGERMLAATAASTLETSVATPRRMEFADYKPKPDVTGQLRPGAMQAFALPSLENGARVPRARPQIIMAIPGRYS